MSGDLSSQLGASSLSEAKEEAESGAESKAELTGGGERKGRPMEENGPRQPTEREGPAELRDLVDDVLFLVFRRVAELAGPKSLCAVELSCRRFHRLAQSPTVYRGFSHLKVGDKQTELGRELKLRFAPAFHPLGGSWTEVMELLLERGARPRILELEHWSAIQWSHHAARQLCKVAKGLRTLVDNLILCWLKCPAELGDAAFQINLRRLECLVLSFTSWELRTISAGRGARMKCVCGSWAGRGVIFSPDIFPALRVLIVRCEEDAVSSARSRQFCEDLRKAWEGTALVCLMTPSPELSFLKGPKDQTPHPDLLRLSQRPDWAH